MEKNGKFKHTHLNVMINKHQDRRTMNLKVERFIFFLTLHFGGRPNHVDHKKTEWVVTCKY